MSLLLSKLIFKTGLVRPFEIGWDYTRVAVLQYSDDPRIEFYLKDYQDKTTLLDAIDSIPYKGISNIIAIMWYSNTVKGGNTRTGDAIRFMMDRIFSIEAGSTARGQEAHGPADGWSLRSVLLTNLSLRGVT